jgi:hypothetical protein
MLVFIVAVFGVFIGLIGAAASAAPGFFRELVQSFVTPKMLYGAIGLRLAMGAFFVFASQACSWPLAIGTIGGVILVAGFAGLFIGLQRVEALIAWFLKSSDVVIRVWAVIAVLFGAFVVYAAV